MVSPNFRRACLQELDLTQISKDHDFFHIFFSMPYFKINFKAYSIVDSMTYRHHQVVLSNWWSLKHFILNQILPSFYANNICNGPPHMVHSHCTLCLRFRNYLKRLSQHPWYGLWMRVKGPHHCKVTALGSCVKWP